MLQTFVGKIMELDNNIDYNTHTNGNTGKIGTN